MWSQLHCLTFLSLCGFFVYSMEIIILFGGPSSFVMSVLQMLPAYDTNWSQSNDFDSAALFNTYSLCRTSEPQQSSLPDVVPLTFSYVLITKRDWTPCCHQLCISQPPPASAHQHLHTKVCFHRVEFSVPDSFYLPWWWWFLSLEILLVEQTCPKHWISLRFFL